jgi:CRISPR-associated protein Cas2
VRPRERLYLICYDIADPRRLNQVARFLVKRACRVQYSVYVIETTPARLDELLEDLAGLINPKEDDVRAYPLPRECEVVMLGTQLFPDDVLLIQNGHNLLRLGEGYPKDKLGEDEQESDKPGTLLDGGRLRDLKKDDE